MASFGYYGRRFTFAFAFEFEPDWFEFTFEFVTFAFTVAIGVGIGVGLATFTLVLLVLLDVFDAASPHAEPKPPITTSTAISAILFIILCDLLSFSKD